MSLWGEIRKKSNGETITKEDENLVYFGEKLNKESVLKEGVYRNIYYTISTTGLYPSIVFESKLEISAFSGSNSVIITDNGVNYNLFRDVLKDASEKSVVRYAYSFNQDGDYVPNVHPDGRKYSIDMLEEYAKKFIDLIIKAEHNLQDKFGKNPD